MKKIGVVQFPGSNCERETALAIQRAGMLPVDCFWHSTAEEIQALDGYVIVGGFSYEDRLRSGVLAALEPVMDLLKVQTEAGKPLLGICNGAQILMESGLVPGLPGYPLAGALLDNLPLVDGARKRVEFFNDWCVLKASNSNHAFTNQIKPGQHLRIPFAHAQGRFILPEALVEEMIASGASYFQYVSENPNGSVADLAAISNKAGNVMAMMPHPERCSDGDVIFDSMRCYLEQPLPHGRGSDYAYKPQKSTFTRFEPTPDAHEFIIEQIIEDNTAKSLELALTRQNFTVTVKRYEYWSIQADMSDETLKKTLHDTAELYNPGKASPITLSPAERELRCLICDHDNPIGRQKLQFLQDHFNLTALQHIQHGQLFCFSTPTDQLNRLKTFLLDTNLLFNPYGETGYEYF